MKKNLAFLLGISPDLAFAAGNVALSLRKYMTPEADFDIVVYHTGVSDADAAAFSAIPNCRLVRFDLPEPFVATILNGSSSQSRFRTRNQLMAFSHFEVFALLDQYRHVAWLDADISVQASLAGITQFAPFGLTRDTPWPAQNNFTTALPGYDLSVPGLCSAVMLVSDALPYRAMCRWCYYKAAEYARYLTNADQGIINLLFPAFRIAPRVMPLEEWQCIAWRPEACRARIVHFGTERKVWSDPAVFRSFPGWYDMHRQWLDLGGSDFDRSRVVGATGPNGVAQHPATLAL